MIYCTCGKQLGTGYTAMHERDEKNRPIPSTFNYDFWVCANCLRPAKMVLEKLTNRYSPKRATSLASVRGIKSGRFILAWHTGISGEKIETMVFHAYPRKMNMDQGRDVCVGMWHQLDGFIDSIRAGLPEPAAEIEKAKAQATADCIALIMSPFYADATAVLMESMNRWTARQEGRDHESPGLAEHIWQPAPPPAPSKPKVQFDEQKLNFIRHCLNTGSQTPEVLANMFSCSVEDIKAAV